MLDIRCEQCGEIYHATESKIGAALRCLRCGQIVHIVAAVQERGAGAAVSMTPPRKFKPQSAVAAAFLALVTIVALYRIVMQPPSALAPRLRTPIAPVDRPAVSPRPALPQIENINLIRPTNGEVLYRRPRGYGGGTLTATNGNDVDAVVSLLSADGTRRRYISVYVRAGQTATVPRVPDGDYVVHFVVGEQWDGRTFRASPEAFEFDDTFRFEKHLTEEFIETSVWKVTLHRVLHGNATTRQVAVQPLEGEP